MTAFLHGLLLVIGVGVGASIAVRWLVPPILRLAEQLLGEAVAVVAALLLLPEYLVSTARRSHGEVPPRLAHEYGDLVAGCADLVRRGLSRMCRDLTRVAMTVPLPLVGGFAAVVEMAALLR